jgi:class 3 adenylate cyclase/tetratricopeptide (TPR) repeat protein
VGCAACGHDNPIGNRFCGGCGAALARRCPACASPNPPDHRFCGACGAALEAKQPAATATLPERTPHAYTPKHLADKILASRAALEGERKQVTVLFADVRGSMELAEQVDAEQWHAILDRFFAILTDGVHRFEGTVNQYTGDGIMALFGAPLAHEDHAQRACYAALHLRDALREFAQQLRRERGLDFATRIGINSGEVVVGKIGDDLRMDYTAQGHTVGLAQRMESLAEAGRIYLTAATAQLAHGYFALADLGEFRVKGASEPLRVHELLGPGALRTRFDLSRARGLSRFVGRASELATLEAALARAAAGQGSVVGVVAEPGTGKSRLCFELAERARGLGFAVREAAGVPHGKQVAFLPVLTLLRGLFGIAERDADAEVRQKIAGALVLLDASFERVLPVWFEFLGAPDPSRPAPQLDPADRERLVADRERLVLEGLRRLVRARSERGPALLLLEDLHCFDAASEKVLATLVEAVRDTRTLLLLNFRPEFRAEWMQRSEYQRLPLRPLGPEAIAGLLAELLGAHASVAPLGQRIAQHAGGNPFFVEELVHGLVESGALTGSRGSHQAAQEVASLVLPATVQAVLAARIDRLGEREKHVLHTAAVLGPEFEASLLARIAELPEPTLMDALRALAQAELVLERSLYPEVVFAFKHPLTQEVALRTQLASRRAERHAAAARAIEAATPAEKLDERAALLAHHWEQAGEKLFAAREHMRAARAVAVRAPADRIEHAAAALRLCQALPESGETLALSIDAYANLVASGLVFGTPTTEIRQFVDEARELTRKSPGGRAFVNVLLAFAMHRAVVDVDYDEALSLVEEAGESARRHGDALQEARAVCTRLVAQRESGRLAEAIATAEELRRFRVPSGGTPEHLYVPHLIAANRGILWFLIGRLEEAEQEIDAAIEIGRRVGHTVVVWALFRERIAVFRGDIASAERDAGLSLQTASADSWHDQRMSSSGLGIAHALKREWTEAARCFEQALSLGTGSQDARTSLAEVQLELGDLARAREITRIAADFAQRRMPMHELPAQLAAARILVRSDGLAARGAIEAALARAAELIASTGARVYAPDLHLARAGFAQLLGDAAARERELREALRLFAELGAPLRVAEIERELAS